jgi:hypothetical protein
MEYRQQYVQQSHGGRHAPGSNMRPAYPTVNTTEAIYTPQDPYFHQLPPAHVLQYLSPPLLQQQSPLSSYPSSVSSSASRHSAQSYSPSPSAYAFTPPALVHQSSSLSTQSVNYQARQPQPPVRANARALIIGVNYFTQKGELSPAATPSPTSTGPNPCRDARNLYTYLIQAKHYAPENIILLTDDQNGVYGQPTRKNILKALDWVGEAGSTTTSPVDRKGKGPATGTQEKVVIYYSGHGQVSTQGKSKSTSPSSQRKGKSRHSVTTPSSQDPRAQEQDSSGLETIYPVDFRSFPKGQITPEEIDEKIQPAKRRGVKMTIIFDAYTGVR